ncbi:DUF1648 domain-containing protein [Kitasatospora kifunensis]|uniref:Putative membrane protein n=1 Tax=Kitasatospora kifunensis TaxID=58351 RepID=A0A7W7VW52_KITKI|nr:DUF5808 domain-containing protein [Kitasatospora kifunensis]MBB4924344.1 putative membrane protein [Kitasatospora kifunensis]
MSTTAVLIQAVIGLLLLAAAWLTPSFTLATLPFGVRVPSERVQEPVVTEQRRAYRWWIALAGSTVLAAGTAWGLGTDATAAAPVTLVAVLTVQLAGYLRAHRAIAAVKQREEWFGGLRQGVAADTSLRTDPARFPWPWALPAVLLTLGTAVAGVVRYPSMPAQLAMHFNGPGQADRLAAKSVGTAFAPVFAQLGTTLLLLLVSWLSFRARPELDPARVKVTADQHRRFLARMARCLMALTFAADLTIALFGWRIWDGARALSPLPLMLPVALALAVVLVVALRSGQHGSRIPVAEPAEPADSADSAGTAPALVHRDDDRYWRLGGLFYLNRADSAAFVPKRFGVGWTINLGSPYGMLFVALTIALAVGLPLLTH